jgi:hypothetical protein
MELMQIVVPKNLSDAPKQLLKEGVVKREFFGIRRAYTIHLRSTERPCGRLSFRFSYGRPHDAPLIGECLPSLL